MLLPSLSKKSLQPFHSFGRMPIANGFLTPEEYAQEYFFELRVGFDPESCMVQLMEQPDPQQMFHDHYAFFSSTSKGMAMHFQAFAEDARQKYLAPIEKPFVVELGSNDGIMLQHFAKAGIRHLGIEPSSNVAEIARKKGISTISSFFSEKLAEHIVSEYGQADLFLGANVMCHIPDMHSVAAGIQRLLHPKGLLIFEDPYLGDILEKTSYDQIYDEHAFYFSATSISSLFQQHGLEVVDVLPQKVHGGSMRYVIGHKGKHPVTAAVSRQLEKEGAMGLHRPETYDQLHRHIERSRDNLLALLQKLKSQGKRIVGYGATSKSTTVTNYCGITPDLIEYISDTTPIKQGKYNPGTHIPVRPYEDFVASYPDYALLFAWNHAEEIMAKEDEFRKSGGKWIVYVPKVEVL